MRWACFGATKARTAAAAAASAVVRGDGAVLCWERWLRVCLKKQRAHALGVFWGNKSTLGGRRSSVAGGRGDGAVLCWEGDFDTHTA